MNILIIILLVILIILLVIMLFQQYRATNTNNIKTFNEIITNNQRHIGEMQSKSISEIGKTMQYMNDNVTNRLEQVHHSIGEISGINSDVYELKKILSNVKTRGILGELQLKNILSEILSPAQYVENCRPIPHSRNTVEFAIKLPGKSSPVYLPIDSKFPGTLYHNLCDAYESGDTDDIDDCAKTLVQQLTKEAADIHNKYIEPPYTTDFGIMFLPFEGLYIEAVKRGMIEFLLKKYNICIAGPSTMAAFVNALMLGFNTLAIEQKASEVLDILSGVKTEFEKFGAVLETARRHANMLANDLEKLEYTRTNAIIKKLKDI